MFKASPIISDAKNYYPTKFNSTIAVSITVITQFNLSYYTVIITTPYLVVKIKTTLIITESK